MPPALAESGKVPLVCETHADFLVSVWGGRRHRAATLPPADCSSLAADLLPCGAARRSAEVGDGLVLAQNDIRLAVVTQLPVIVGQRDSPGVDVHQRVNRQPAKAAGDVRYRRARRDVDADNRMLPGGDNARCDRHDVCGVVSERKRPRRDMPRTRDIPARGAGVRRSEGRHDDFSRNIGRALVSSNIENLGRSSMVFDQKITKDNQLLVEAQVKLACVSNTTFKPTVIPQSVLIKMESV